MPAALGQRHHVRAFVADRQLSRFLHIGQQPVDGIAVIQVAAVIERRDASLSQVLQELADARAVDVVVDFENLAKELPAGAFLDPSRQASACVAFVNGDREARILGILIDTEFFEGSRIQPVAVP